MAYIPIPRRSKSRAWVVALAVFAILIAISISAVSFADRSIITGSIAGTSQLPTSGRILQSGKLVGIATGAKYVAPNVEFAEIRQAKNLDITREFDFNGYQLAIARIRVVRYPDGNPRSAIDLEHVVAHIRAHSKR